MIVVIDTNVFVSAVLRGGLPRQVLEMVVEREDCYWMATQELLAEYESVIRRPRLGIPPEAQEEWLRLTRDECFMIETPVPALDFPRDRKDVHVLQAAAVAEADYLITGDRDFSEAPHGFCGRHGRRYTAKLQPSRFRTLPTVRSPTCIILVAGNGLALSMPASGGTMAARRGGQSGWIVGASQRKN